MKAAHLSLEIASIRIKTHRLVGVSLGIHLLLFLLFALMPKISYEEETLTEITWLEPVEAVPAALPVAVARTEPVQRTTVPPERPSVHEKQEHFEREHPLADIALEPQKKTQVEDKLKKRLAVLQRKSNEKPTKVATITSSNPVRRPALAGVATSRSETEPSADLTRRKPAGTAPIELKRSPVKIQRSTMLAAPAPEKPVAPVQSNKTDTQAQRTIAGASLTGPVADRPLISYTRPEYPEWAKKEAVEGSVTIYFVVLPDGRIKENVMVQKTSGFGDFDDNAIHALLAWHFAAMEKGAIGEQWGTITFHYRLSDSF